jgi:uncharacterized protein (TIGR03435 family)
MSRNLLLAALLSVSAALAQAPRQEFEVASIKPFDNAVVDRMNVGVHLDGAQVHVGAFSLKDYLLMAYDIKIYQLEGPDWISSARFDVDAKLPAGMEKPDIRLMMRSLLEDRFGLKTHKGSKELPVYAIVVAPDGVKMQESKVDPADPPFASGSSGSVDVKASGGREGVNLNYGHGTTFAFANNKIEGRRLVMPLFVDVLGRFTDRPVLDKTNLTAAYDFTIDLSQEDYMAMLIRSAVNAGVTLPPEALRLMNSSDDTLVMALRRLGLKLENRKAPVDTVVVDQMRKTPSEN